MKISTSIVKALIFVCLLVDVALWSTITIALLKWTFLTLGTMFWPIASVVVLVGIVVLVLIGIVSRKIYEKIKLFR